MEGCEHGPPNFRAPTRESLTYKCRSLNDEDWLQTQENQCWSRTPSLVTGRRRLVAGPGFEKLGVAGWHNTNPTPPDSL